MTLWTFLGVFFRVFGLFAGYDQVFRGRESCGAFEGADESSARAEAHALRDGLDGEVAVSLKVVDAVAGLLDSALAEQDAERAVERLVDDAREHLGAHVAALGQLVDAEAVSYTHLTLPTILLV